MPHTLLILNGKEAGNQDVRNAVRNLRDEGVILHVRVTWEQGDAKRYVDEAAVLAVETIIAGGGDGTINEVASALMALPESNRPSLGILPLGTANDFATSCSIPLQIDNALQLAIKGRAVAIDLAQVNDKHYFINMATGGFGTRITTETPEKLKAVLGGASYFIHGLMRMDTIKADSCEIRGPGFEWSGDALVIGIGNGRQAGGGQPLCPDALINDGLLQLRLLIAEELLPALLTSVFSGEKNKNVIETTLPWLEITAPHDITFNLDGEPLSGKNFRIEVIPNAIQCRLPPNCELLG
ncbi:TPA: lipid kinase YegS [Yersinia enterocolitica]|uniref:lipid kinase YegS n=1 Tax=Yersinia enterocolitica TaxID=630 RepID=UPI00092D33DB|nr:lipid kinase YegS [Yersinia enterocolitica]EKN3438150.1 lipid kinase YegS [Yersinia enterocolitica]EKN3459522.1 lipid kinase YegS [Yersinia enterocolitica]EKN3500012.1 lipid kinase YegS [Yersinia enterocolitica]EKN3504236.1 lipid kinase YegS [Yersinia enterocolitica]EKN3971251.1 lipid kinase YegS [Yersinia enterocolitica]